MQGRSLMLEAQGEEESLADSAARIRALLVDAEAKLERSTAAHQALKQAWADAEAAAAVHPDTPEGRQAAERERAERAAQRSTAKSVETKVGNDRTRVHTLRRTLASLETDMAAAGAAAGAQVAARA